MGGVYICMAVFESHPGCEQPSTSAVSCMLSFYFASTDRSRDRPSDVLKHVRQGSFPAVPIPNRTRHAADDPPCVSTLGGTKIYIEVLPVGRGSHGRGGAFV